MEITKIPLSLVTPSPMNPRKTFNEDELQELADNIEKQGLLQPITVRPIKDAKAFAVVNGNADFRPKYEIICGERRFRAFTKLSDKWSAIIESDGEPSSRFSEISAIVRDMNDEEAFDAMITENLQRKDVDPIEEAFAFGQLIQKGKTAEEVAARFGKSVRFVQDRVKLNNLIPELMLAVREDEMPIVAAMIISKLDEDAQRKFFSQYQHNSNGYSKRNAEQFIDTLFMTISKSLWHQSDDQSDEDFEGGCDRKCSECNLNTANHGCLFWEMKNQDAGRCTNREKFQSKTIAYMLAEIDKMGDSLVKRNQPLTKGKTVLFIKDEPYDSEDVKQLKNIIRSQIEARDLELVDQSMFRSQCYYENDDERVAEFLKNGEVYPCLELFDWRSPTLKLKYWYVLKGDTSTNSDDNGIPFQVNKILESLKSEENTLAASLACAGAEALVKCDTSNIPMDGTELALMMTCMLNNNYSLCQRIGMNNTSDYTDTKNIFEWIKKHKDKWPTIMKSWLFQHIYASNPILRVAEPMLDSFGKIYCPESYKEAQDKVHAKFNKIKAKAENKLRDLGYGLDGKPLVVTKKVATLNPDIKTIKKQFKAMKAKYPEAILIFRMGDFYQIFNEDAEIAAPILGLNQAPWHVEPTINQCGFIRSALDTFLPKLIRAGKRVAICEQLEDPKKKSNKGEKKDSNFPSIEFVEEKREEFPNSLLLFHVGEYYECYDQDAEDLDMDGGITFKNETKWGHEILVNRFHENERDKILALLKESDLNPQIIEEPK